MRQFDRAFLIQQRRYRDVTARPVVKPIVSLPRRVPRKKQPAWSITRRGQEAFAALLVPFRPHVTPMIVPRGPPLAA